MTLADQMGLGPKRELIVNADGSAVVHVTPPSWVGNFPTKSVRLTPEQLLGYDLWLGGAYIQDALRDLSPQDREIILNGGVET